MARSKPYTFALGVVDFILTIGTGGGWLVIILIRELYRRQ